MAPIRPEATLDLGGGAFVPGLPEGDSGGGPAGSCLFGCDTTAPAPPAIEGLVPPEPARPARVHVGGDIREPRKVRHVAPVYPPLAVAARVALAVVVEFRLR